MSLLPAFPKADRLAARCYLATLFGFILLTFPIALACLWVGEILFWKDTVTALFAGALGLLIALGIFLYLCTTPAWSQALLRSFRTQFRTLSLMQYEKALADIITVRLGRDGLAKARLTRQAYLVLQAHPPTTLLDQAVHFDDAMELSFSEKVMHRLTDANTILRHFARDRGLEALYAEALADHRHQVWLVITLPETLSSHEFLTLAERVSWLPDTVQIERVK